MKLFLKIILFISISTFLQAPTFWPNDLQYFNFTNQNMKSIEPGIAVLVYFSDYIKGMDSAFEEAKIYALK